MKRTCWYIVKYFDGEYYHEDQVRGLKESKALAKAYNGTYEPIK